ncbi:MAG TPA: O-antigen ligase family protein [Thermoguttaceae bacterium]|nr:O-antigen ligase family protein [Thermoguttaceae bacterium]
MNIQWTGALIVWLVVCVVAGHVALALGARKIHAMFLMAGAFLLFSPVSGAMGIPAAISSPAKFARVYTTILMILLGISFYRVGRIGPAAKVLLVFTVYYVVSAMWGETPIAGLMYKGGVFGATVLAGVVLALSTPSIATFRRGLRFLAVLTAILGAVVVVYSIQNPQEVFRYGRLDVAGLLPIRVAMSMATGILIWSYLAVYDRSRLWRWAAWPICGVLSSVVVLTGSRGAAATVLAGFFIQAVPLMRRGRQFLVTTVMATILVGVAVYYIGESAGALRMTSTLDTRGQRWTRTWNLFLESPVIGRGWIGTERTHSAWNAHSTYFQIALETGAVGVFVMSACLLLVAYFAWRSYKFMRRFPGVSGETILVASILGSLMVDALSDSAMVFGSMPNTLFLGFAVGMIDRLPGLVRTEMARAAIRWRYMAAVRRFFRGLPPARPKTAT